MRENNTGTRLGYNMEAHLDGSSKGPNVITTQKQLVLSSMEAQEKLARRFCPTLDGGHRCWVRIRVTALLPNHVALSRGPDAMLKAREGKGVDKDVPYTEAPDDGDWEAALSGPSVTDTDCEQLLTLRATPETIITKAQHYSVRFVIDAE